MISVMAEGKQDEPRADSPLLLVLLEVPLEEDGGGMVSVGAQPGRVTPGSAVRYYQDRAREDEAGEEEPLLRRSSVPSPTSGSKGRARLSSSDRDSLLASSGKWGDSVEGRL